MIDLICRYLLTTLKILFSCASLSLAFQISPTITFPFPAIAAIGISLMTFTSEQSSRVYAVGINITIMYVFKALVNFWSGFAISSIQFILSILTFTSLNAFQILFFSFTSLTVGIPKTTLFASLHTERLLEVEYYKKSDISGRQ